MSPYRSIARVNLRYNLLPYILAGLAVLLVTPALFSVAALDTATAAYPLELALPFVGVALLTPVFAPEQDERILQTIAARETPYLLICALRLGIMLVLTLLFTTGFGVAMRMLASDIAPAHMLGTFANAVFLGGLGLLVSAISGNLVIGYMAPIAYFAFDLMGGMLPVTLFSMMRQGTLDGKVFLLCLGILWIIAGFFARWYRLART